MLRRPSALLLVVLPLLLTGCGRDRFEYRRGTEVAYCDTGWYFVKPPITRLMDCVDALTAAGFRHQSQPSPLRTPYMRPESSGG